MSHVGHHPRCDRRLDTQGRCCLWMPAQEQGVVTMLDLDLAPTLAECQCEAAEEECAINGHLLGENEDGELFCECCGATAFESEEPPRLLCKHYEGPDCEDCS